MNVLVIDISRSVAIRRIFEDTFSSRLCAAGISAVASYTLILENEEISNDRMNETVARIGAAGSW